MAKIPNQTNIAALVKSQVDDLNNVIDVIVNASTKKTIKNAGENINNLKSYQTVLNSIFGKDGIFTVLNDTIANISPLNTNGVQLWLIKKQLNKILNFANQTASIQVDPAQIMQLQANIALLVTFYTSVGQLFNSIKNIEIPAFIRFTLLRIKLALNAVAKMAGTLSKLNKMQSQFRQGQKALDSIMQIMLTIGKIFDTIKAINVGIKLYLKMVLIPLMVKKMVNTLNAVNEVAMIAKTLGGGKDIQLLSIIFLNLAEIFKAIKSIPTGFLMYRKILKLAKLIRRLNRVIRAVRRLRIGARAIVKLLLLKMFISNLGMTLLSIILITPIMLLAVPAMLVLIMGMFVFRILMWVLVKIINKAAMASLRGIIGLILITGFLTILAVSLLVVVIAAKIVLEAGWTIIKFIGLVVLITIALAIVGAVAAVAMPFLIFAGVGLLAMCLVIGILFLMGVMLWLLEKLDLDKEKIEENVEIIIGVAQSLIDNLFKDDDTESKKSEKSWIGSVIEYAGGALASIVKAILAVAYLALMMVAILFILLIATWLRLLEELNLNEDKILENVDIVINTAEHIIASIFEEPDNNAKNSNKNWIGTVFEWFGSSLAMIIKAIMAVAYLALVLISITFILIIAGELRLLQELNLDDALIVKNVNIVIETAQLVISSIFDGKDKDDNPSTKGWIPTLISWFDPDLAIILEAIMALVFLAIATVTICLILLLAGQLRGLQEINLEPELIKENVNIVISTCQLVIDSIVDRKDKEDNPSNKSWIRKLFEWMGVGSLLDIIDVIMALAWLGFACAIISLVVTLANHLSSIAKIDLPAGLIKKKTNDIIECANSVVNTVVGRKDPITGSSDSKKMKLLKWLFPALAEAVEMMSKMRWVSSIVSTVGVVKQVCDVLMTINDFPDPSGVTVKARKICDTADEVARMVVQRTGVDIESGYSRLRFLERLNRVIWSIIRVPSYGVRKAKEAVEGHMLLLDKINQIDTTKLETSAKLFEHMAKFSTSIRGDFEFLAKTLNENIMPVLLELKEILTGTSETMEHMNETIKEGNDTSKALKEGLFGSDTNPSTSTNANNANNTDIYNATLFGKSTTNTANDEDINMKINEDALIKDASTIKDLGDILNQIKKGVNSLADCVSGSGSDNKFNVYF